MKTKNTVLFIVITIMAAAIVIYFSIKKSDAKYQKIYNKYCFVCHQAGGAGSPKLGEPTAWNFRIEQGRKVLITHTINGLNFMPKKGSCAECTEEDLAGVIDYMLKECPKCEHAK